MSFSRHNMVKTKIICTLGPASSEETIIRKMMLFGMDVVRLNFSHSSHKEVKDRIALVRKINKKYRRHVRILGDLEGNRIRIGRLENGKPVPLFKKRNVWLTQEQVISNGNIIPFDYKGELNVIKKGHLIYIDDGRICLRVNKIEKKRLKAEVIVGGVLEQRKGVNIPQATLDFPIITEKDRIDAAFAIDEKFDYLAQSFVRSKKDVLALRKIIDASSSDCKLIAKIENRQGIKNIDQIVDVSDGIMVARGDMGISIPIYEIPIVQKEIIEKCNKKRKFVITATQMLESMVEERIPTRAEATDVANAILDGTDFVMLSAETAKGKYPAVSVKTMNQIIRFTEGSSLYRNLRHNPSF